MAQSALDTTSKVQLKEVLVKPKGYNYTGDTAANRQLYKKSFRIQQEKVQVTIDRGIAVNGLFSELAYLISGKKKAARTFNRQLKSIEQDKWIDHRYTPELVIYLTSLPPDSAILFMQTHHISFDFARVASDLELKMWIREQYRAWIAK